MGYDYHDDYSDHHLMSHRHGLRPVRWTALGLALAALVTILGLGVLILGAFTSSACSPSTHDGKKVCQTTGPNHTVVYVPWAIWTNGGTYHGVSYSSDGDGSSYSSYGNHSTFSDDDGDDDGGGDGGGGFGGGGDGGD
jgi:hypothetical protein